MPLAGAIPAEASGKPTDSINDGVMQQNLLLIAKLHDEVPKLEVGCSEVLVALAFEVVHIAVLHAERTGISA